MQGQLQVGGSVAAVAATCGSCATPRYHFPGSAARPIPERLCSTKLLPIRFTVDMELTPVRIRGKKRKAAPVTTDNLSSSQISSNSSALSTHVSKRARTLTSSKLKRSKKSIMAATPALGGLPQELLEMIFLYSMNTSLPRASSKLGRKLSSRAVTMKFVMHSFYHTVNHTVKIREREIAGDPILQSQLLACRFFTWDFFLAYVEKAHETRIKQRGRIWKDASVEVPGRKHFDGLMPFKFMEVTYLGFAEGFHIPEKLLQGPWTADKASLLYVLVALSGEVDWQGSMAGEMAKNGLKQAIRENNERAVAALSVLLGISRYIDTGMVRLAVIDCGCNMNIVRHILFNAQILHRESTEKRMNFHDGALWRWAESHEGKGVLLKDLLKKAEKFSLEFYLEGETDWTKIIPFPYGGAKFGARTALDNVAREMLIRLYKNYGKRITSSSRRALPSRGESLHTESN